MGPLPSIDEEAPSRMTHVNLKTQFNTEHLSALESKIDT